MKSLFPLACFVIALLTISWTPADIPALSVGQQPQISADNKGIVRLVFGRNDSIFCATSDNQGISFRSPALVGYVKGMHLGMARGPQMASSVRFTMITAIDKAGDIYFFQLTNKTNKWIGRGMVNDLRSSAPEGLMSIAADDKDHFYAVWLDTRIGKRNNIYFSSFDAATNKWSGNKLVYQSPDSHVCECCKPNIAVQNGSVAIMFRNWLQGSRDLYLIRSEDRGNTFGMAQKLGTGTWKLNGCPMDGGGLVFDKKGTIHTTWQRQGNIYICQPGQNETILASGRTCGMVTDTQKNRLLVSYQDGENTKLVDIAKNETLLTVKGTYLKSAILANGKIICAWESNKSVSVRPI